MSTDADTLARYRKALEQIAALVDVEVVLLSVNDVPNPQLGATTFTTVDPRTKNGLDYAAGIAKKALDNKPT